MNRVIYRNAAEEKASAIIGDWRNYMMNEKEKENVERFFGCLYANMYEFIQCDNKGSDKNKECFEKCYLDMVEAFKDSEDVCQINWERMWKFMFCLDIFHGRTEEEEAFEKYRDIDIFFGILYTCMMTAVLDSKANEGKKSFIENVFKKAKEKFKTPEYVNAIPWNWMWQILINSEVYAKAVEKMGQNREDNLNKNLYSGDRSFFNRLIYEDTMEKYFSRFTCVLKSNYIGFNIPNADGTEGMKGLKQKFDKIIRELDQEGQIEKIFELYEEGKKRPVWTVSVIDAIDFYLEINKMGSFGTLGCDAASSLYSRFCSDDGWKKGYERVKKLIGCYGEKGDCKNWYEEYKWLDRVAEMLCDLVPVIYYEETGNKQMKTYRRWKEDCEKIIRIVHEKPLPLGIDQVEVKAAELVRHHINAISENRRYDKQVQTCFKERYLEFLTEQSERFFRASERVYEILKSVDNEKDRAEIAKKALDELDINL